MKNIYLQLKDFFYNEKFLHALPIFFFIAFLFHFTILENFSISIDEELFVFLPDYKLWISQGRWMSYLFQTFILPDTTIPYFPVLIFIGFISLSYLFVLKAHGLKINLYTYALFPIFCAFPTWAITEFSMNIPPVAFGFLLLSSAAWLFRWFIVEPIKLNQKGVAKSSFFITLIISLLIAIAIGSYQSLVLVFVSIGLGIIVLTAIVHKMQLSQVVKAITFLSILLIAGIIIYSIISFLFIYFSGTEVLYVDKFFRPDFLFENPMIVLGRIIYLMEIIYSGSSSFYGISFGPTGILLLIGFFTLIVLLIIKQKENKNLMLQMLILGLAGLILVAPFGINFISSGYMPVRSMIAVAYSIWFFALLAVLNPYKIIYKFSIALLAVSMFQMLYASSLYSATRQLVQKQDEMLALSIYQQIVSVNPNFDRNKDYTICIYGSKKPVSHYPTLLSSLTDASFFSWDDGDPKRMIAFMKLMGFNNLVVGSQCDNYTWLLAKMPKWPAVGSVKHVKDVTLIKLDNI